MLSHKRTLAGLSSSTVLALVLLLTAAPASAQTTPALSEATPTAATAVTPNSPSAAISNPAGNPAADQSAKANPATAAVSTAATSPAASASSTAQVSPIQCKRNINASVVAFSQPYMLNRLGAAMPNAQIFALENDVDMKQLQLKGYKRARPIVLRANVGDCLRITLKNAIYQYPALPSQGGKNSPFPILGTTQMSVHVQGMNLVDSIASDGSFVGANASSLAKSPQCGTPGNPTPCVNNPGQPPPTPVKAGESKIYNLYAQQEGSFLLYSLGDANTTGQAIDYLMIGQIAAGLIGAVNIQPEGAEWYRSQVTASDLQLATFNAKRLPSGAKLDCPQTEIVPAQCKLTIEAGVVVTTATVKKMADGSLFSMDNHPIINYDAVYPDGSTRSDGTKIPSKTPILKMLDADNNLVSSDLTALITGPYHGRFPGTTGVDKPEPPCSLANAPGNTVKVDPLFCANPTLPDRKQPYREVTVVYHEVSNAAQAFQVFETDNPLAATSQAGMDAFAINYGTGGIGAEIYANRIGVGPMANCVDCKYEEFFLSSWTVGDPAMIVDVPANATPPPPPTPCNPQTIANGTCKSTPAPKDPPKGPKATRVYYPDDPSNIYHSYLNDHVKFRILHGGNGVTHVHHQHAEQWLQSPNSDQSTYLDSQIISPGASYSLEMVYDGSGNLNKTVGDSLFHCHFYPHFAAGMWGGWRVHDVFEAGTVLENGKVSQTGWNRALPDGEIASGVPIPAVVPLPTLAMAPIPARVKICQVDSAYDPTKMVGSDCPPPSAGAKPIGYAAVVNQDDLNKGMYPGYPFFIPAVAGTRAPHPPMDFAPETDAAGNPLPGKYLDGGLPRHLVIGGTVINEEHTKYDWSKDFYINCQEGQNNKYIEACKAQQNQKLGYLNAVQLPEAGTTVEQAAMKFNSTRNQPSFTPSGVPGFFLTNGLPRKPSAGYQAQNQYGSQLGAPFADPGIDLKGNAAGGKLPRRYKAAVFQLDVSLNRNPSSLNPSKSESWHFPQQRILSLWEDVIPTSNYVYPPSDPGAPKRAPEPLFFRANSGEVIEVWHTNLVPNYYQVDDFQVRTPTDILGQHIHLVKFDVQASDGAANGYNYEDGTFSPTEVQEIVHAINNTGGTWNGQANAGLKLKNPPAGIIDCTKPENKARCQRWAGAQTTVQRWYADPVLDASGKDRTLGTVFTHDHYGPSTHQQAGLYAGLLVEPAGARWRNSETGKIMGGAGVTAVRPDGGPTSWKADILAGNQDADSFREFALEFQDFQLAYSNFVPNTNPVPSADPSVGYRSTDPANRVNTPPTPQLVSSGQTVGTFSLNYRNEPVPWRVGQFGDLSEAFNSNLKLAPTLPPVGDPTTPLLRAYQNDRVEVRVLVGAHQLAHFFNIRGMHWLWESDWKDSGYRSSMGMGLSEHTEMKFRAPYSSSQTINPCPDSKTAPCKFTDYLYITSAGDNGITNGMWGLFRAYSPDAVAKNLQPLPNNPVAATSPADYATCPANLPSTKIKNFDITAIDAQNGLSEGAIVLNSRGQGAGPSNPLTNPLGLMYVFTADLEGGKLKAGAPREPLILRAAAGDCINVTLRNGISPTAQVLMEKYTFQPPFNQPAVQNVAATTLKYSPSKKVGIHPQLLSYDATTSNGLNIGYNPKNQVAAIGGASAQYQWYAGKIERDQTGTLKHTPVEFGSLNLIPSDPLLQHINGLYGAMVIEPDGVDDSKITCDGKDANGNLIQVSCGPLVDTTTTVLSRASANITVPGSKPFREFVVMMTEDLKVGNAGSQSTISAVNYRTEPTYYRLGNPNPDTFAKNGDNNCSLSNGLVRADPQTPIYTAQQGAQVRFRMLHPPGTGIVQVFSLHGHVWQRNPYAAGSTQIGDNKLSQWMGSLDNLGATAHYDLVINQAGGPAGVAGDYLYSAFVPAKAEFGLWGIFRVLDANGMAVTPCPSVCVPATTQPATLTPAPVPGKDLLDRFRIKPATVDEKPQ